jgi:CRP/FNR family transcriptional regulator, anaerobic regulatory protein
MLRAAASEALTANRAACESRIEACEACLARPFSLCSALPQPGLHRIAALATFVHLPAGTGFIEEGDPAEYLFNITRGAVKIFKSLADGRRQITGFLSVGGFLGFDVAATYTYSAETLTETHLCRFQRARLEALLAEFPRAERHLLAMACTRLADAQEQMMLLGRKTALERLASFLLVFSAGERHFGRSGTELTLPMKRSDIADHLGLTVETVSRLFTQLRMQGMIGIDAAGKISLPNPAALEALASGTG